MIGWLSNLFRRRPRKLWETPVQGGTVRMARLSKKQKRISDERFEIARQKMRPGVSYTEKHDHPAAS